MFCIILCFWRHDVILIARLLFLQLLSDALIQSSKTKLPFPSIDFQSSKKWGIFCQLEREGFYGEVVQA
jgi:hypothetical protein